MWAWEYAKSLKKRQRSCHLVIGLGTKTWLQEGLPTKLGLELGYRIGRDEVPHACPAVVGIGTKTKLIMLY